MMMLTQLKALLGVYLLCGAAVATSRGQPMGADPNIPPEELLFISPSSQSFNEFGKQRSHTKVDVLGSVLKKRVSQLRQHPRQEVDLVILVDSSASVGSDNFYNEIKFIRKLLADFTVSTNTTRVVVITYSSVDRVLRQVDHMTQPSPSLHKCLLLEEEIPTITYNSGGTYTLGAIMQAIEVFQHGRPKAAKAVFLITDGYSNGGDPVPAADLLKELGVTVFTFGIRNGNVKELKDMASLPTEEHSFILDSFQEFEALARRALHEDLSEGVYLPQDGSACNRLCHKQDISKNLGDLSKKSVCCDPKATCSCGTHTGHYACICPPGHFGRGLLGDCNPCPAGTYRQTIDPGDKRSCLPCPIENQTSDPGSHSVEACRCKNGYQLRNGRCQLMDCPVLEAPTNGYFVRNSCQNVFNSACGIQCNSGYQLEGGTGVRLCLPNGQWSGTQPRCVLRRCPSLQPPRNGDMNCLPSASSFPPSPDATNGVLMVVDTECRFTCRDGYRLVGSPTRTCLPIALWTGLPAQCKPIKCPRLRRPNYGELYPSVCGERRMHFGERCAFACRTGFELQGPTLRECLTPGVWTGGPLTTRCVDTTPPNVQCPADIVVTTLPNLHYAVLNITLPKADDNSGYSPSVVTVPALTQMTKFKIGTTNIKVGATDLSGNTRKCSFSVTVKDAEAPVVDFCQSPPIFLVDSHEDLEKGFITDIEWTEPIFHDNSLDDISVQVEIMTNGMFANGRFPIGETTKATYTASDSSGNNSTCTMEITVQKHHCLLPADPINGHKNCSESDNAVYCTLTCHEGFAFAFQSLEDYFCPIQLSSAPPGRNRSEVGFHVDVPGRWFPDSNPLPFPDCSVVSHTSMIVTPTTLTLEFAENGDDGNGGESSSTCDNPVFLKQVANEVKAKVQKQMSSVCGSALYCDVTELEAICQDVLNNQMLKTNDIHGRTKRSYRNKFVDNSGSKGGEGQRLENPKHPTDLQPVDDLSRAGSDQKENNLKKNPRSQKIQVHFKMIGETQDSDKVGDSRMDETDSIRRAEYELLGLSKLQPIVLADSDDQTSNRISLTSSGVNFEASRSVCAIGSVPITKFGDSQNQTTCVNCPPGTYFDGRSEPPTCHQCPQGSYQPHPGQVTCYTCPSGTFTKDPHGGSKSIRQCKARCRPGTYSADGLERCITCPIGFYQTMVGAQECLSCPPGTTTTRRGADLQNICQKLCPVGHVSESGLSPCIPCPGGTFQDQSGQVDCVQCPFMDYLNGLSNQFQRLGVSSVFECNRVHKSKWNIQNNKKLTRIPMNECFKYPCLNGGSCFPQDSSFTCLCPPGFTGSLCEMELNFCLSSPCLNGGQCQSSSDGRKSYTCKCQEGFQGDDCEFDEDECLSSPCLNDGMCVNEMASYLCLCKDGYQGANCEQQVNDCIENACQNGGTCIDGRGNYSCNCRSGFSGFFCEIDEDECLSNPCQNGGTCIDGQNEFHCICPQGYEGDLCQTDTNECALFSQKSELKGHYDYSSSDACLNGGACRDKIGFFECECRPGFTGKWCEQKLPSDYVLEFGSMESSFESGTTEYVLLSNRELPNMKELTFCFWMMTNDKTNYGTPLSYATSNQDNEITFTDYSGFVFAIKGNKVVTDVTANDGTWMFLCAVWSSSEGYWAVYQNSVLADEGKGLSKGETIQGNGILLLGQEQDALGSKFSASESFRGRLTRMNIWNRVLNHSEITEAMTSCVEITGNVASWADFHRGIQGLVQITDLTPCQGCTSLEAPVHGYVTISSLNALSSTSNTTQSVKRKTPPSREASNNHLVATYSCEEGYAIVGSDLVRACGVLGDWRGAKPTCRLVNCGFPGYLANGYVIGQSYLYGDVISYDCRPGFHMVDGDRTQRCTRDGTWAGRRPVCQEITCRFDEPFLNGNILNAKPEYQIGESVELRCNGSDLNMDGPSQLTCLDDGTWSDMLPTCQGPPCPKIPKIENGDVLLVADDHFAGVGSNEANYPTNTVVTYVCQEGFKFLAKGVDKIFCLRNGVWSGHRLHQTTKNLPKCLPVECSIPGNFQHGQISLQSSSSGFNTSARIVCDDGYQIFTPTTYSSQTSTSASLRCSARETWVMLTAGNKGGVELSAVKCRPMRCTFPEDIQRGIVEFSGLSIGSMARYSCQRPYRLVGRAQRRCLSTGSWSHKVPKCV